jgi:hypothetical protein
MISMNDSISFLERIHAILNSLIRKQKEEQLLFVLLWGNRQFFLQGSLLLKAEG